jgi:cytochrome c-type biogenesis protein CcmF
MRVQYKPLVRYVWLGAVIAALGGLVAILDRRYRSARAAQSVVAAPNAGEAA